MADRWLVVGLGNPGTRYAGNRHNVGQMVLDELARRVGTTFAAHKGSHGLALAGEGRLGAARGVVNGPRVVLAKPTSYMNTSGGAVSALAKYYDVAPENVVVVHDEMDIPFGDLKLKIGGGEGGHNGLRDTTKALGTKDYVRVRVGVGRPPGRQDPADYVLKDFSAAEKKELPFLLDDAADAVEMVLTQGLLAAQGKFHTKS